MIVAVWILVIFCIILTFLVGLLSGFAFITYTLLGVLSDAKKRARPERVTNNYNHGRRKRDPIAREENEQAH